MIYYKELIMNKTFIVQVASIFAESNSM